MPAVSELFGFALIASYSTAGDEALTAQATLNAVPETVGPSLPVTLFWSTLNVSYVGITGNNHVDYQAPPPPGSLSGFNTGLISTTGSGIYPIPGGFTASITLTLQAYDASQNPIGGLTSVVVITVT
jgi:hypothetical protein